MGGISGALPRGLLPRPAAEASVAGACLRRRARRHCEAAAAGGVGGASPPPPASRSLKGPAGFFQRSMSYISPPNVYNLHGVKQKQPQVLPNKKEKNTQPAAGLWSSGPGGLHRHHQPRGPCPRQARGTLPAHGSNCDVLILLRRTLDGLAQKVGQMSTRFLSCCIRLPLEWQAFGHDLSMVVVKKKETHVTCLFIVVY